MKNNFRGFSPSQEMSISTSQKKRTIEIITPLPQIIIGKELNKKNERKK